MISLTQMAQAFVPDVHWLLAARLVHGMFSGFGAMAMALAVSLGAAASGWARRSGWSRRPSCCRPPSARLIGGVLSDRFGLRTNFLVTGVLLLIPMSVMFFLVQRRRLRRAGRAAPRQDRAADRAAGASHLLIPGFAAALGILFVARFADQALPPILPLFLSSSTRRRPSSPRSPAWSSRPARSRRPARRRSTVAARGPRTLAGC